jgi:hypothetical protein
MIVRLLIENGRYVLSSRQDESWVELATLPAGAAALLDPGLLRVREYDMEAAIERSEDWLMPHAAEHRGAELRVVDAAGWLFAGWAALRGVVPDRATLDSIENVFLALVRSLGASGAAVTAEQRTFMADVVLIRELAHHLAVTNIELIRQ